MCYMRQRFGGIKWMDVIYSSKIINGSHFIRTVCVHNPFSNLSFKDCCAIVVLKAPVNNCTY